MKRGRRVLLILLAALLGYYALLFAGQRYLLFPAPRGACPDAPGVARRELAIILVADLPDAPLVLEILQRAEHRALLLLLDRRLTERQGFVERERRVT